MVSWMMCTCMPSFNCSIRSIYLPCMQDTILAQKPELLLPLGGRSVQVLNEGGYHWVTVTTADGKAFLFESAHSSANTTINSLLKRQLSHLLPPPREGDLQVYVPWVQQQVGGSDCGLFVIAYTIEFAKGRMPEKARFSQAQKRQHLIKCFESQEPLS